MSSQAASWRGEEEGFIFPGIHNLLASCIGRATHSHALQNQLAGNIVISKVGFPKPVRQLHGRVKPMLNNSPTFYLPFAAIISSLASRCRTIHGPKQVDARHPIKSSYLLLASQFIPRAQIGKKSVWVCMGEGGEKEYISGHRLSYWTPKKPENWLPQLLSTP